MSTIRKRLEYIEDRLASASLDEGTAADCAAELSRLGSEATAMIEAEFSSVVDAEPSAA